ncbi:caprin-2 [Cololabis saira]|uniref:caprin-2 n=1 Tax=Cololabis saira TaxID=129043 RepID=UPI002AD56A43|nr:caprin-2 [Cololabis saira]
MVQLSPSPVLDSSVPAECPAEADENPEDPDDPEDSGSADCLEGLKSLQLSLEVSTAYHGYDTYIEDGLICLKHKIRNLEKKKLKLKDYKKRLTLGETLNKDQKLAVEKYDEVVHNLEFARELHKTLDDLTQNLLKAQKKAAKKEQLVKTESERRRLTMVLKIQHLLASLQQDHISRDLQAGHNQAPHVPALQLQRLNQLAGLLGVRRDDRLSLEEQMEKASLVYMDLLEGADKPVAGSTYKSLKQELIKLLSYKYFSCLPPPPNKPSELLSSRTLSCKISDIIKSKPSEASKEFFNRLYLADMEALPTQTWKDDFQVMREREPPDSWDAEIPDEPSVPQTGGQKRWRGAATLMPRAVSDASKKLSDSKQRKGKKAKGEHNTTQVCQMDIPVEVFKSPSTFPKDPILRKQHLEDLMMKIHSSFNFIQDSFLDGENSPTNGQPRLMRRPSGTHSPLAQSGLRSPADVLPKTMTSTPLPARLVERKSSLTSGDQSLHTSDLELSSMDPSHETLQLADGKSFSPPPHYRRESVAGLEEKGSPCTPMTDSGKQSPCNGVRSCTSTPPQPETFSTPPARRALTSAQFQNIQSVFKAGSALPQNGDPHYKLSPPVFETRYSTVSTQTPPEFAPADDEPQLVYQSDYSVNSSGQSFLSPGQLGGGAARPSQSYYRGSVRGMARGGKGLAQNPRSSWWHRGGSYMSQAHFRDSGPPLYAARDSGYQHYYRRGGRQNSSVAWSDSSQVSSPDREGGFTIVDSGHGDSMSVSTVEVPLTPHSHPPAQLLPMQLYPLSQPLRVAFTASRTVNFAPGNLDQPIVFDQLHSNLGEMYDTHIGRFTCPVSGTYVFIFHILKLAINVPLYVNLMRNEDVMVSAYANDGAPDHETASNHAILPLFQGDQVWLRLHRGAIYGSTWKYSTFSGFLLYQD